MVHISIVLPHMDYASIVWGRCPNMVNNDRISKLQKISASKDRFNTMNWMPFYDRVTEYV